MNRIRIKHRKKSLLKILPKSSGRNNTGKITAYHRGGRQKRYLRKIDFKRDKLNVPGKVVGFEYDPNRNVDIALIEYLDGDKRYILRPENLFLGSVVVAGDDVDAKAGNVLPLDKIPIGSQIHNLEITPRTGGKLVRGAGTSAVLLAKEEDYAHVKLPSGEVKLFLKDCMATIGQLANASKRSEKLDRAGRARLMGRRPKVRGTAQNPSSHPHGGGEGRSGEGRHPKTPWGKPARGKKTRKKKKYSDRLIIKRRK